MLDADLRERIVGSIRHEFDRLKKVDSSFTLRRFSELLGMPPEELTAVMSGKRRVTVGIARKFLQHYSLGQERDAELLKLLYATLIPDDFFDRAQIEAFITKTQELWNAHDAVALARGYTEDGSLIEPWGLVLHGRPAIEAYYIRAHSTFLRQARISLRLRSLTFVGRRAAFMDLDCRIDGILRDGETVPRSVDANIASFIVRRGGRWFSRNNRPAILLKEERPWKLLAVNE